MPTPANPVWKPSSARSITLDAFTAAPRGTTVVAPPPLNWPTKDPKDVLDYQVDITPALIGNDGDAIATLDVTISPNQPGDLSMDSAHTDGPCAVLWLSGGQAGTVYTLTLLIGTRNGRTIQRSVLLPVLSLSSTAALPNAIVTDSGVMVTDQNGNPVLIS